MRRYQVLVESNFPAELNQLFRGLEGKGNPWNMSPTDAHGLGQGPGLRGARSSARTSSRWSRSTGCSGSAAPAPTRTAPRRRPAPSPSCSTWRASPSASSATARPAPATRPGAPATSSSTRVWRAERRDPQGGQGQAGRHDLRALLQHPEERVPRPRPRARGRAPHPAAQPARPRRQADAGRRRRRAPRSGRSPTTTRATWVATTRCTPRRASCCRCCPGPSYVEMERSAERSFCCGAGGARMWMEETIGERINENRTNEAVATGADQIAVGCPFCRVMLSDGLTAEQARGEAREEVEVLDVAQMLLASVKGDSATRTEAPPSPSPVRRTPAAGRDRRPRPLAASPRAPRAAVTKPRSGGDACGGSLFDDDAGSLFDEPRSSRQAPGHRGEVRGRRHPGRGGQARRLAVRRRRRRSSTPRSTRRPAPRRPRTSPRNVAVRRRRPRARAGRERAPASPRAAAEPALGTRSPTASRSSTSASAGAGAGAPATRTGRDAEPTSRRRQVGDDTPSGSRCSTSSRTRSSSANRPRPPRRTTPGPARRRRRARAGRRSPRKPGARGEAKPTSSGPPRRPGRRRHQRGRLALRPLIHASVGRTLPGRPVARSEASPTKRQFHRPTRETDTALTCATRDDAT